MPDHDDSGHSGGNGDSGDGGHSGNSAGPRGVRFTRRRFLKLLAAAGAAVGGVGVLRWLIGGPRGGAGGGTRTGGISGFTVLNVERAPSTPADQWVVTVDGLVEKPLRIDRTAWTALPRIEETADFHCVEGWSVDALRWGGVAPRTLLEQAGVKADGGFVSFHAAGGTYVDSLSLEQVMDTHTLLADTLDAAPLAPEHGGPLRLVVPTQLGYKNVKWVARLEVTAEPARGYWEQRGYPIEAPVR